VVVNGNGKPKQKYLNATSYHIFTVTEKKVLQICILILILQKQLTFFRERF
jgi:hypothetical protein